jgi:hypothetical protein
MFSEMPSHRNKFDGRRGGNPIIVIGGIWVLDLLAGVEASVMKRGGEQKNRKGRINSNQTIWHARPELQVCMAF